MTRFPSVSRCLLLLFLGLVSVVSAQELPQTITYENPAWGYTVEYPTHYHLINDPRFLKMAMEKGMDQQLDSSPESEELKGELKKLTGHQFVIFAPKGESLGPNLTFLIERVSSPDFDNAAYFHAAVSVFPQLGATLEGELEALDIHGREFLTQSYQLTVAGQPTRGRIFTYYDPSERLAYVFSITADPEQDSDQYNGLLQVLMTFQLKDIGEKVDGELGRLSGELITH